MRIKAFVVCVTLALVSAAYGGPRLLTYQGSLLGPDLVPVADGSYDMRFRLFDAQTGGTNLWEETDTAVQVTSGLFATILGDGTPFPEDFFGSHADLWLEVAIDINHNGTFEQPAEVYSPRQRLTSAAWAMDADRLQGLAAADFAPATHTHAWNEITSIPAGFADGIDNDTLAEIPASVGQVAKWNGTAWIAAEDADSGGDITAVQAGAGLLGGGQSGDVQLQVWFAGTGTATTVARSDHNHDTTYWALLGNAAVTSGTHFLGPLGPVPLDLCTSGSRALRLEPTTGTANLIGGFGGNGATAGAQGVVIGGGGTAGQANLATDSYCVIGGGTLNQAGNADGDPANASHAVVCGGVANSARSMIATVVGGFWNTADGSGAFIGGGWGNTANGARSVVAGGSNNTASGSRAFVGGGYLNTASGWRAVVAGGEDNTASGDYSTVAGGYENISTGTASTVAGGRGNRAGADYATVAGGGWSNPGDPSTANRVTDDYGTVGGGANNQAGNDNSDAGDARWATVAGGEANVAGHEGATVCGGVYNRVLADYATIAGGNNNLVEADGWVAFIGAGNGNTAHDAYAVICGGSSNEATIASVVAGGLFNSATGMSCAIAGGEFNSATSYAATISGGYGNTASGFMATIGGGGGDEGTAQGCTASGPYSTVAGGYMNVAAGYCATVGGGGGPAGTGYHNYAYGDYSTIPGGCRNDAYGNYSFAAGRRARALHDGCFVWADSTDADFNSGLPNQFKVRATGGVWFTLLSGGWIEFYNAATWFLRTSTGAYLSSGGVWTNACDRAAKENFEPVEPRAVLEQLAQLPVQTWNYKREGAAIRHIGPVAQDFYAAFGFGRDDTHISTVDADGVALAAIQGLYEILKEKDAQIAAQQQRIEQLESRLEKLEKAMAELARQAPGDN